MISALRSVWIWVSAVTLIVAWLPLLTFIRLFDHDPARYRTGRWFRRLGTLLTKVNPSWTLEISGEQITEQRRPFVVVCNHQSLADIPLISNLPWEMKWLAKKELFRLPVAGWMLKLAGDIPVDRKDRRKGAQSLLLAARYLEKQCPVMFFPEGTRSPDGRVHTFSEGAFHLAIKQQVPVLPLAIDGSHNCLPKHSLIFGRSRRVHLRVFEPVETIGLSPDDSAALCEEIRGLIIRQIAAWRCVEPDAVDATASATTQVQQ